MTNETNHYDDRDQYIDILSQSIAELQRRNKQKAAEINNLAADLAEKDDRIVELVNKFDQLRDDFVSEVKLQKDEIREDILQFADDHNADREWINGLLTHYLDMEPVPERVEVALTIYVTAEFEVDAGAPPNLDDRWLQENLHIDATVYPGPGSGLKAARVEQEDFVVRDFETF